MKLLQTITITTLGMSSSVLADIAILNWQEPNQVTTGTYGQSQHQFSFDGNTPATHNYQDEYGNSTTVQNGTEGLSWQYTLVDMPAMFGFVNISGSFTVDADTTMLVSGDNTQYVSWDIKLSEFNPNDGSFSTITLGGFQDAYFDLKEDYIYTIEPFQIEAGQAPGTPGNQAGTYFWSMEFVEGSIPAPSALVMFGVLGLVKRQRRR